MLYEIRKVVSAGLNKKTAETQRHRGRKTYLNSVALCLCGFLIFCFLSIARAAGPPTIVFMTDYGTIDDSVALCKGVMIGIEPDVRIIDITHEVQPYSIPDATRFLAGAAPYFGSGTVFVVVVDPGVGSTRKPIVVKSKKDQYFVLPDNGLITLVEDADGIEAVREITNQKWMIGGALSSTFHGRDIFSPVAAHIAKGEDWKEVGPKLPTHVRLDLKRPEVTDKSITAEIIALDGPYGNLITNITADVFEQMKYSLKQEVHARINGRDVRIPFVKTFSDVPLNKPLFYIDSRGRLGVAINQGNFAKTYKITPPQPIVVYLNPSSVE
jgi:S-adenosylmethionine hydrolase